MKEYFGIKYEFDRKSVFKSIDQTLMYNRHGYVCVADGVVLSNAEKDPHFRRLVNSSMLTVCDSSWVPFYIRMLYGDKYSAYSGSDLFMDLIAKKRYKMMFLGSSQELLQPLRGSLSKYDERISTMPFVALPYCNVEDFDYDYIAKIVNYANPDIIWVSLGAPKQEEFMSRLTPLLNRGVLLGVGAVFSFFSGKKKFKRAPRWMVKSKIEWLYRLFKEPVKQIRRIRQIVTITPTILLKEFKKREAC